MSVISGEVSSVLMEFYRGHVIEITIVLQKYQNTMITMYALYHHTHMMSSKMAMCNVDN